MKKPCLTKSLKVYTPRRITVKTTSLRENGDLLFYYSNTSMEVQKRLIFGLNLSDYFGVAADVYSAVDPVSWLSSGSLNRSDVFEGLISFWQFWNMSDKSIG